MKPLISIISECHSENLGDQAIERALSGILRPYYRVSTTSFGRIVTSSTIGPVAADIRMHKSLASRLVDVVPPGTKARVRWHLLRRKEKFFAHFSAAIEPSDLVVLGGGQLIKNNISLFCEKLALVSKISRFHSIPFALVGVGVDGRMEERNWRSVESAITTAEFVILRDELSRGRIQARFERRGGLTVLPDLAFALGNPHRDRSQPERDTALAVNVMDFSAMLGSHDPAWGGKSGKFVDGLCDIILTANQSGASTILFTTGTADDLRAASDARNHIITRTGVDLPVFHPSTLDELLAFLGNVKDVIAARMHAGVLAYVSGCNPLCVSWDDKVEGVWSSIHQAKRVIDVGEIVRAGAGARVLNRLRDLPSPSGQELERLAGTIRHDILERVGRALE